MVVRCAVIILMTLVAASPALAQKKRPVPRPLYSAVYAADRPYLRRGYCHGDFQLCDMMGGT